jgi:isoleucyl-tRNA synthetase
MKRSRYFKCFLLVLICIAVRDPYAQLYAQNTGSSGSGRVPAGWHRRIHSLPEVKVYANSEELLAKYAKFMQVRTDVLKAIENARNEKIIGKSMSAKLVIKANESVKELLNSIKADLATVFIVSEFVLSEDEIQGETFDSGVISVTAREGVICDRCWKVVDEVSEDGLCERCAEIIKNMEK